MALDLLNPQDGQRILDYGTGDGYMLEHIRKVNAQCTLVGYEPVPAMYAELVNRLGENSDAPPFVLVNKLDASSEPYDSICCLEVLEHLTEENQRIALDNMRGLLGNKGQIIISVPIEIGVSSLLKNIARVLLRQTHSNTNLRTLAYSLIGLKINRGSSAFISSHIGFYYRDLLRIAQALNLKVEKTVYSPFRHFKGLINSQVFFVMRAAK